MKTNLKRVLSFVLVMMMLISCVPAVALAAEDVHAAQNITTGVQYDSLADAMAAATTGQTVKVLADCDDSVMYNEGVILDLNGHNLTNVTVPAGVTLTAIDSATNDYAGSFGTLSGDIAGTVASTVKTAEPKSYVSVCENGTWSFHRYYAAITAISLKPASAALGYKAEFYGDEVVRNAVTAYGYALWVNDNAPKTLSKTDNLEKNVLTLRLQNILKEGNDALNALGSTANINGKAFITLNLNGQEVTLSSAEQTTTLRSTIESINANVAAYNETALQAVRSLCTTYAAWMAGWATENIFAIGEGAGDLDVEITVPVTAENNVVTEDTVLRYENIVATVPAGAQLAEGTTELKLTIIDKNASDSDVAENEGETLRPLDVHIEGISENNNAPIIICLGNILPKGLNIGNYELYHVEDGETVPMTRAYSVAELDAHNEFCYDPATGAVTVAVVSFSEIALRSSAAKWTGAADHSWYKADAETLYIYNADQLWSFSQIVGGMMGQTRDSFAGQTVVLYADIDLNDNEEVSTETDGKIFYPIGYYNTEEHYTKNGNGVTSGFYNFEGTFDGNGHTISNFYQNTWEMKGDHNWYSPEEENYRDGMGLFGKVYGGTVKNLTVKNFSSDGEIATTGTIAAYADCGATFENITIFNCNPRVYNIGNGGIVGVVGWYAKEANTKVTFKNITVDNSNKISALWGSWDVPCGGLVGTYYPQSGQSSAGKPVNGGIDMINCHVSAQIDVNNDVCANYQYYAYRYAGMLIGSVDKNVTISGREYPDMTGITAEDCTVHFGDWNDYYYCELVANSQASYTHDYQMSRLTQVASVDVENKTVTTLKGNTEAIPEEGRANYVVVDGKHGTENATCYHFVDGAEHKHEDEGTEVVDGETVLVEDKQHIYLEFNNLITGTGWGVTSKGVGEMGGVTILDREVADSVVKFDKASTAKDSYLTDATITLGELFTANAQTEVEIQDDKVQVTVSPVGDSSTANGVYTANAFDWTQGTLKFSGEGAAEIIITDYYFCVETKLTVNVTANTVTLHYADGFQRLTFGQNIELPSIDNTEDGKEFVGWVANELEETDKKPTVIAAKSTYSEQGDSHLYAVYTYKTEVASSDETWNLVTDASDLAANDVIVIAGLDNDKSSGKYYALGATQGNNNRPAVEVTKDTNTTIIVNDNVQLITLGAGTDNSMFSFSTDEGYLYAAASGSNHLRSQAKVDTNASWTIEIDNDGIATIKATKSSNRNWMRLNHNSGTPIFSCYSSGQMDISIYKKSTGEAQTVDVYATIVKVCENNDHKNTSEITAKATCTEDGYTKTFCADCGATISKVAIPALGHTYQNGACTVCGKTEPEYSQVTDVSEITSGKYVIAINMNGTYYAMGTVLNDKSRIEAVQITVNGDGQVDTEDAPVWTIDFNGSGVSLHNGSTYLISGSDGTSFNTNTSAYYWAINEHESTDTFKIQSNKYDRSIMYNTENTPHVFGHYADGNYTKANYFGYLYLFKAGSVVGCAHENATTVTTEATCTAEGGIVTTCPDCGHVESETIEKLPHNFVDGSCTVCHEAQVIIPDIPETGVYQLVTDINDITAGGKFVIVATVEGTYYAMGEFNTDKKAVLGDEVQINGNYVTTADAPTWIIGKYGDNIALQGNDGAYLKQSSKGSATLSDLKNGGVYAWTVLETENAGVFHIASSEEQDRGLMYRTKDAENTFNYFRSYKLDTTTAGYYPGLMLFKLVEGEIPECEHNYTSVVTQEANCTETGIRTYTCSKCNDSYTEAIPTNDVHSYNSVVTAPTCTTAGYTTHTCSRCEYSYTVAGKPATGEHTYENGMCTVCGAKDEITQKEKKFVKVTATSDITDGDKYLIVYEDGNLAFDGELTSDTKLNTVAITINGSAIAYSAELEQATFTISKGTIKGSGGRYIGNNSDSNALTYSTSALTNTISIDASGNLVVISKGGAYLRFNAASDQLRFRYYKSSSYTGQKAICLYKLVEE